MTGDQGSTAEENLTIDPSSSGQTMSADPSRLDRAALIRDGEIWTVEFGGVVRHVRGLRGFEFLARLLVRPGAPVAARDVEGRGDSSAGSDERARINVTRAIQAAVARLGGIHPTLAEHLRATVHTGKTCVYRPDPRVPIQWSTRA